MIISLKIKNIALIQELELALEQGLNILSGETGAGKSIIIDSLNFVLGDRADKSLIRHGETSARVEVVFSPDNQEVIQLLSDYDIEQDDVIIVSRVMTDNGRSECRINSKVVNLSTLRTIVGLLVDIHAQHENQSLINVNNHIKILDNYALELASVMTDYKKCYSNMQKLKTELKSFASTLERERLVDILSFQVQEIKDAMLKEGEEEQLLQERSRFYNYQKIFTSISTALTFLQGEDGFGAVPSIVGAMHEINAISKYDTSMEDLFSRLDSVKIEISDIIDCLTKNIEDNTFDAVAMEKVEKRIDLIRLMKKKYGSSIKEIMEFWDKSSAELERLTGSQDLILKLEKDLTIAEKNIIQLAKKIDIIRRKNALTFEKGILSNLNDLGMSGSQFVVDISIPTGDADILSNCGGDGANQVQFLISPNRGEPLRSLAKIVSGGEMSRLMLALKNIIAELDGIDTLVFDEIDSGISGRIAKVVACKLYNIARTRQVIAVTHLPQLATMADNHYLISKSSTADKTTTTVVRLDSQQSIAEIMRLAGSTDNSQSGIDNAKDMKEWANNYKTSLK